MKVFKDVSYNNAMFYLDNEILKKHNGEIIKITIDYSGDRLTRIRSNINTFYYDEIRGLLLCD